MSPTRKKYAQQILNKKIFIIIFRNRWDAFQLSSLKRNNEEHINWLNILRNESSGKPSESKKGIILIPCLTDQKKLFYSHEYSMYFFKYKLVI